MKIAKPTALTITFAVIALYTSESAAPTTVTHAKVQGLEVTANLARVEGCMVTEIRLFAAQNVTRIKGSSTTATEAIVDVTVFDVCTGQPLDRLDTVASSVTLTGNIDAASLDGSLLIRDSSGNVHNFAISLVFTGVGTTVRDRTHEHIEQGNTRIHIHHDGHSRDATVEGSIDGQDVAGTVFSATLTTEEEATLTMIHN